MSIINSYETVMVFSMTLSEEVIGGLKEKFKSLVEKNGTVVSVDEWGKRRLAYPINDESEGFYVLINFDCDPSFIAELERIYKITDGVLRSIVIKKEPVSNKRSPRTPAVAAPVVAAPVAAPAPAVKAEAVVVEATVETPVEAVEAPAKPARKPAAKKAETTEETTEKE